MTQLKTGLQLAPTELTVEWAISKKPGDFEWYKSDQAAFTMASGQKTYPCGGVNGASTGAYFWSQTGSYWQCKVANTGK